MKFCQDMTLEWNTAQASSMEMLTPCQGYLVSSVVASRDQVEDQCSFKTALVQATELDLAQWFPSLTSADRAALQNNDPALALTKDWVENNSF